MSSVTSRLIRCWQSKPISRLIHWKYSSLTSWPKGRVGSGFYSSFLAGVGVGSTSDDAVDFFSR
jgi:hypothetical protein